MTIMDPLSMLKLEFQEIKKKGDFQTIQLYSSYINLETDSIRGKKVGHALCHQQS